MSWYKRFAFVGLVGSTSFAHYSFNYLNQKERFTFLTESNVNENPIVEKKNDLKLELKTVQVLVRHGLRTPLYRFPNDTTVWKCNHFPISILVSEDSLSGNRFHSHSKEQIDDQIGIANFYQKKFISDKQVLNGNCKTGQLTLVGLDQLKNIGVQLRKRYVENLNFISDVFTQSEIFIRSTNFDRTVESAQSLMWGLYPPTKRYADSRGMTEINVIEPRYDSMSHVTSSMCPRIAQLDKQIENSAEWNRLLDEASPLHDIIHKSLNQEVKSWIELNSSLESMQSHNHPLPAELTDDIVSQIRSEAGKCFELPYKNKEKCKLHIGRFISDLHENFKQGLDDSNQKKNPKLYVFAGHDSTIKPFLCSYNIFDGKPPMMGCYIVMEMYKNIESGDHYIRFNYDGREIGLSGGEERDVTIVSQNENGVFEEREKGVMLLCDWNVWDKMSSDLIPQNFQNACKKI